MNARYEGTRTRPLSPRLREAEAFFMNHDAAHSTRERLARRLSEEEIPYAVIGGMALNLHGYERMTRDVDVLMMPTGGSTFILLTDGLGAAM